MEDEVDITVTFNAGAPMTNAIAAFTRDQFPADIDSVENDAEAFSSLMTLAAITGAGLGLDKDEFLRVATAFYEGGERVVGIIIKQREEAALEG